MRGDPSTAAERAAETVDEAAASVAPVDPLADPGALLRAILDNTTVGYVTVDTQGRVVWASPSVRELLGWDPADWTGRHVFDLVHPDDVATAVPSLLRVTSGRTTGDPVVVRVRHADGSWRWIEALTRLPTDPEREGALFSIRDVTKRIDREAELQASEARLAAFLASSKDLTVVVDPEGTIDWVSGNVTDITGFAPEELLGANAFELIDEDHRDAAVARFAEVLDAVDPEPMTLWVRNRDGESVPVEALGSVLDVGDTDRPSVLVNIRDSRARIAAEQALRASEARYRTVVQSSYDVVAVIDPDGTIAWVTPNSVRLLGWTPDDVVGRNGLDLVHPDDQALMVEELTAFAEHRGVPNPTTIKMRHKDGTWHHVELVGTDLLDNPDIAGIALSLRGADERVAAEQDRLRLLDTFEITGDLVGIIDAAGTVLYMNEAGRRFFGVGTLADASSDNLGTRFTAASQHRIVGEVQPALARGVLWSGELEAIRVDGTVVPMLGQMVAHRSDDGTVEYISGVFRDISERKAFERRLEHEATHDPLTGLPNRTLLLDRLEVALARAQRAHVDVGVLFCDLDHFKVVNDGLGHSAGDRLLVAIAERLGDQLRPGDTVSRFGGDEFVVLCEDLGHLDDAIAIAERIDEATARPFDLDGRDVHIGVSIGIAVAEAGRGDPEALIRDADAAMYRAKAQGRRRYQVFETDMWEQAVDRLDLERALRRAIGEGEFELHYQPIVGLADGAVRGVEALVRWHHPDRGMLAPAEFIALAEETGLIVPLGTWVLAEACRQLRAWDGAGLGGGLTVAVNLSARQLAHPALVDQVHEIVTSSGVEPTRLELEITESVLMDDVAHSHELLEQLHGLGVRLAVDDFGTGYSSLSYLKRFPVDRLKVDQSFVDGLGVDAEDTAIVTAIISLAHSLGLEATAEGVETEVQHQALRELGCDLAQGFLLAFPLPAHELATRLG